MSETSRGRVSVVIPARNEEANIARAVRSVAAQQGIREIIVVDDQSQDRTGEILEGLKAEIVGLRVVRIESLPEGWLGKTWAVATGARRACLTACWNQKRGLCYECAPNVETELAAAFRPASFYLWERSTHE